MSVRLRHGCFVLLALLAGCSSRETVWTGSTMGTTYRVKVADRVDRDQYGEIQSAIEAALATVNRQMSTYDPKSEVSRFNEWRTAEPFAVSKATAAVVAEAKRINELSERRFDVTAGPLIDLWGFGKSGRRDAPPGEAEILAARKHVGSEKLSVTSEPPALAKTDPDVRIDLSAIAKGYGVDVVSTLLLDRGLRNHLVEIGGEVVARGRNAKGKVWRLGVERPDSGPFGQRVERVVRLDDAALATSGDYRNYFEFEGARYSHTIDPLTGRPVTHGLASVSVVAPSCMQADGLATAVMAMGPEDGLALLESLPDVEGLLLLRAGPDRFESRMTSGMADLLVE